MWKTKRRISTGRSKGTFMKRVIAEKIEKNKTRKLCKVCIIKLRMLKLKFF